MILPNWPAPTWVRAVTTTRQENSMGLREGFEPQQIEFNRLRLSQHLNLLHSPFWLDQTHSTDIVHATSAQTLPTQGVAADGSWTQENNLACVILTADCLPVLFTDTSGSVVSAVHAGWRGLLNGIFEQAVTQIKPHAQGTIMAWLGPAIGPRHFEVGEEVRQAFIDKDLQYAYAFKSSGRENKWLCDLYELARQHLRQLGISHIYGGQYCTYSQTEEFYSYRREKLTGRMATLIWLNR
jgi:YfiH family protein